MIRPPPRSTLFPYTTLSRSRRGVTTVRNRFDVRRNLEPAEIGSEKNVSGVGRRREQAHLHRNGCMRSEEHTSELQSQSNLVCRLLLEKKKTSMTTSHSSNVH